MKLLKNAYKGVGMGVSVLHHLGPPQRAELHVGI